MDNIIEIKIIYLVVILGILIGLLFLFIIANKEKNKIRNTLIKINEEKDILERNYSVLLSY